MLMPKESFADFIFFNYCDVFSVDPFEDSNGILQCLLFLLCYKGSLEKLIMPILRQDPGKESVVFPNLYQPKGPAGEKNAMQSLAPHVTCSISTFQIPNFW